MNNSVTSPTVPNVATSPHVLILLQVRDGELVRVRGTARYLPDAAILRRVACASVLSAPSIRSFHQIGIRPRAVVRDNRNPAGVVRGDRGLSVLD
jgi:hypothetical protein